jgi:hypothetical protein
MRDEESDLSFAEFGAEGVSLLQLFVSCGENTVDFLLYLCGGRLARPSETRGPSPSPGTSSGRNHLGPSPAGPDGGRIPRTYRWPQGFRCSRCGGRGSHSLVAGAREALRSNGGEHKGGARFGCQDAVAILVGILQQVTAPPMSNSPPPCRDTCGAFKDRHQTMTCRSDDGRLNAFLLGYSHFKEAKRWQCSGSPASNKPDSSPTI